MAEQVKQEAFWEAVLSSPDMSAEDKVFWLGESSKHQQRRIAVLEGTLGAAAVVLPRLEAPEEVRGALSIIAADCARTLLGEETTGTADGLEELLERVYAGIGDLSPRAESEE